MEKYLKKLQVLYNNTRRFITGAGRRSKTMDLVRYVNWLTVKEIPHPNNELENSKNGNTNYTGKFFFYNKCRLDTKHH